MAYEESGRTRQKKRTREALVAAARELLTRDGAAPTVEQTATAASISRTTAYRYFPSQRALLVAAHPETAAVSLLGDDAGEDPETRLVEAVRAFHEIILRTEPQQRIMLRLSLEPASEPRDLPLRQGRAVGWFIDALSGLEATLGSDGVRRLAIAVRSAVGIESLVWLVDVAGLSRAEATGLMQDTARALLRAARADAPEGDALRPRAPLLTREAAESRTRGA
jgi:AcrR family transcriptional regulator